MKVKEPKVYVNDFQKCFRRGWKGYSDELKEGKRKQLCSGDQETLHGVGIAALKGEFTTCVMKERILS